jgi:hypothetical protein
MPSRVLRRPVIRKLMKKMGFRISFGLKLEPKTHIKWVFKSKNNLKLTFCRSFDMMLDFKTHFNYFQKPTSYQKSGKKIVSKLFLEIIKMGFKTCRT